MSAAQHVIAAASRCVGRIAPQLQKRGGISPRLQILKAIRRLESKKHVLSHHRILNVPEPPHDVQAVHRYGRMDYMEERHVFQP